MRTKKQNLHDKALQSLRARLGRDKISCRIMSENNSHYDLLVGGVIKIEVKASEQRITTKGHVNFSWKFNFHRHGEIDQNPLDFYALYCDMNPYGIWLIVPYEHCASLYTLNIGWRALAREWGKWEGDFKSIKDAVEAKNVQRV